MVNRVFYSMYFIFIGCMSEKCLFCSKRVLVADLPPSEKMLPMLIDPAIQAFLHEQLSPFIYIYKFLQIIIIK